jgi:ArsR family transcriptional regulator, arsenate/arsenite/antimonite-responsive transcriptional repressor / arsenate reductase (thioredoxin)
MNVDERAAVHAALGDARRLMIVDELTLGDRTVAELAETIGMKGNLLAHHLDVLAQAGVIERRISEGDHRRRYVSLSRAVIPALTGGEPVARGMVTFVCTHNSARSQFAAALWEDRTGLPAESAGSNPSLEVHPQAVRAAAEFGVDLAGTRPGGYERLSPDPDLLISVCDRARETGLPTARRHLHWSVPDPVPVGTPASFRAAFGEIAARIERLADQDGPVR